LGKGGLVGKGKRADAAKKELALKKGEKRMARNKLLEKREACETKGKWRGVRAARGRSTKRVLKKEGRPPIAKRRRI